MSSTFERKGNAGTLVFTIPATEVDAAFKNAVTKIANNVNIPGFRKGKAPRKVIENHYGIEAIKSEAFQMVVNKAYQKALEEHKLVPVADPKLEDEKFEEGKDASFKLTMTLKPEPELGEYKGLKLDKKQLDRLADLPDDQLWRTLKMLAPHAGLELSEKEQN